MSPLIKIYTSLLPYPPFLYPNHPISPSSPHPHLFTFLSPSLLTLFPPHSQDPNFLPGNLIYFHPLLVGMQTCATTLEISVVISQEVRDQPTPGPSNTTLGNIPKRCPIILQKHLFNYVHSSIICNSQNLETT
ncbi:hypothetical protein ACRRTK_015228 [Alexandromys fortis]